MPGEVRQRLRIVFDGSPIYDQELATGPLAGGWDGPAVTGGLRCAGSLVVVDPDRSRPHYTIDRMTDGNLALMVLPAPGYVVSALDSDTASLRRRLESGFAYGREPAAPERSDHVRPIPASATRKAEAARRGKNALK